MSSAISPDGRYWWNGSAWCPAVSESGSWRWDGAQWVPIDAGPPGAGEVPAAQPMELASELDGSPYGDGRKLDGVRFLPIGADFTDADVATGPGWIAFREPVIRNWRLARVDDIKSVGLVGPTAFASSNGRSSEQNVAALAVRTTDGLVMRTEVSHISQPARRAVLRHLPDHIEVTLAARGFLVHGHVPSP